MCSYHYARRQFNLTCDQSLRYGDLEAFDVAMMHAFAEDFFTLGTYVSRKHEADKVIVFERGPLLFLFNFHPTQSYPGYRVGYHNTSAVMKLVLTSDAREFGGWGRIDPEAEYRCQGMPWDGRADSLQVYLPNRSCLVLAPLNI